MIQRNTIGIRTIILCMLSMVCIPFLQHPALAEKEDSTGNLGPQRIVVFPLYAEEILYGLVEPERIVYVGHEYNEAGIGYWPTMADCREASGSGWENSSEEEILSLNPDLLIFGDPTLQVDYAEVFPSFAKAKIPTIFLDSPQSIDEIADLILLLGNAVQKQEEALCMVEEMCSSMAAIRELAEKVPENEKKTVVLYGEPSPFFDIAAKACGINGVYCGDKKALLDTAPDAIIIEPYCVDVGCYILGIGKAYSDECIAGLKTDPCLSQLAAVSSNNIFVIYFSGSQYISDCTLRLFEAVYPELVKTEGSSWRGVPSR